MAYSTMIYMCRVLELLIFSPYFSAFRHRVFDGTVFLISQNNKICSCFAKSFETTRFAKQQNKIIGKHFTKY
jgi:hypothetical protein